MPGERHSIAGRIIWPENTSVEHIAIEYSEPELRAVRDCGPSPNPATCSTSPAYREGRSCGLPARAESNRGPLAGVVTTEVNVDEIDDLELRLGTPGVVEGRVVYDSNGPPSRRATQIMLKQRLLPVTALYPVPEGAVDADGRFRVASALGTYEFEVPGHRVLRVMQRGREIGGGQIRVALGESITDLEVTIASQ